MGDNDFDSDSFQQESESKILWRRLFSDFKVGIRKLLLFIFIVSFPVAIMLIVQSVSSATGKDLAYRYG